MKFKNYLCSIDHVNIYPLIGLVLFVSFFVFVLIYVVSMKKEESNQYAKIPLES
ncbi:MAG: CcoQ/FixQ family Cbb3-type cytochrome c oxidase assembly chaperone [Saprospiraceae bacterium]|nr:CcoQ/FixQ family Cbb3-type cytochrome c oxidase assembly chaperone [Candidatus Vicinibacter proximus]MBL7824353.1 CcoQ/FixQ family Cbb3-type cytochrome c oxidase assembly chaperone [Saprospiraceae bacterium]MCC6843617.1 CcoQ/FixQ family Cbb3-type cytochrome c oxidase assembly chaperone [Saprospiraceae bacterium]